MFGGDGADFLDSRPLAGSPASGATLSGGPGNDLLVGLRKRGNDLRGDSGADKLIGGDGEDRLFGGDGNDTLLGAVANDDLNGGKGNDRLVGGRGIDKLGGGPGRDRINSLDVHREKVLCGTGFDRVRADRRDRLFSCERAGRRR